MSKYQKAYNLTSPNLALKMHIFYYLGLNVTLFIITFFQLISVMSGFEYKSFMIVTAIALAVSIFLHIYYISKMIKDKQYVRGSESLDDMTTLPSNDKPAIVAYLMQGSNINGNDLTSTLLDLISKKYLIMDQEYRIEDTLDNKKNVVIRLNNSVNMDDLCEYEKFLINWFIQELGENGEIKTSQLRNALKKDQDSGRKFWQWQKLISKEFYKINFVEKSNKGVTPFLYFVLLLFIMGISNLLILVIDIKIVFLIMYILAFLSHFLTIRMSFSNLGSFYKLTEYGKEMTRKWNGFINYINEHSIIGEHNIFHGMLYEKYFIYAVALNIAYKVDEDMEEKYGQELYKI